MSDSSLRLRAALAYADRLSVQKSLLLDTALDALEEVTGDNIEGNYVVTKNDPDAAVPIVELEYDSVAFRFMVDKDKPVKVLCRREASATPVQTLADIGEVFKDDEVPLEPIDDEPDPHQRDSHSTSTQKEI